MRYSFSRIETYINCPYKFLLRYIAKMDTLPDYDNADNPLTVGNAMHHGIEQGIDEAVDEYLNSYPVTSTEMETEALKISLLAPKVQEIINPNAMFEFEIKTADFIGYVDYIDPETNTILDFKYSNNKAHYLKSPQIHLYRYLLHRFYGMKIERQGYLFIPKLDDEREDFETEELYREYIRDKLNRLKPNIEYVKYDEKAALRTLGYIGRIENTLRYEKKSRNLCWYCEFREYCESNGKEDWMILPKNERRTVGVSGKKRLWIYGSPFSGKTTLCDSFPDVLMLNTDGRIDYVTAPYVKIADQVTVDGHITKTKMMWEVFKETIDELAKKDNDYKSIVIDLLEDTYEGCRLYVYKKLGISHESESSFSKAWDMVRTEFLSTIKKLMNLDYENIVLVSHEDSSKNITKRSGESITTIRPNIQDKIANKIAGMVDVVVRAVVIDGEHKLKFKSDENVFGGGRINFPKTEIDNDYDKLMEVYDNVIGSMKSERKSRKVEAPKEEPVKVIDEPQDEERTGNDEMIENISTIKDEPTKEEETPSRTRRRRRT